MEEGDSGVEDRRALTTDLDADGDLIEVDEVRVYPADVRRGFGVEVELPEVLAELERLDLKTRTPSATCTTMGKGETQQRTSPSGVLAVEPDF